MDNLEVLTYGFALSSDQGAFGYSTNSLLTVGNNRILIDHRSFLPSQRALPCPREQEFGSRRH